MRRPLGGLLAVLLLASCAPTDLATLQQDLTQVAQEQVKKTLARYLTGELGKGVDLVMANLARPGGYLDDPLVRILLPPPLGLALGVARELSADPQAALMETLMNQAAEQAIPGAAPILRAALTQITPAEARNLLDGGGTAATEYLKAKTLDSLRAALAPTVTTALAGSGAQLVYAELIDSHAEEQTPAVPGEMAQPVAAPDLKEYVTEQAIEGLFKAVGVQEARIRDNFDQVVGGMVPGMQQRPVVGTPKEK